jgi:hypothetical protein
MLLITFDPENRLVVDELERRWDEALHRVQDVEQRIEQHKRQQAAAVRPTPEEFECLARDLETVWSNPDTDARLKKRIVRTLIHEVIAEVDQDQGKLILIIHWKGGIHTQLNLQRRRRGQNGAQASKDVVEGIKILARVSSDEVIAGVLTRNGCGPVVATGGRRSGLLRYAHTTRFPGTRSKIRGQQAG